MACSIWNLTNCVPDGVDTDQISVLMLSGYNQPQLTYVPETGGITSSNPSQSGASSGSSQVTVETTTPALAPVAPVTQSFYQSQVDQLLNKGWNTSSRTVNPLANEQFIQFYCMDGIRGAFLGVAPKNLDHWGIHLFSHALIVDREGIQVMEKGVLKEVMSTRQKAVQDIRIYRHADNTVVYVVTTSPGEYGAASPSVSPSTSPSVSPSEGTPSSTPSSSPTGSPSTSPSGSPSSSPSNTPSGSPSGSPSASPSEGTPSDSPSASPSEGTPSTSPSEGTPSESPSTSPSEGTPSGSPSYGTPSSTPSSSPSEGTPSGSPSSTPIASIGSEVWVYKSLVPLATPINTDAYVYGKLYESGDQITDASFNEGLVGFGEV